MWESDYKERCSLKNWCFWTVVLEKIHESPFDRKEIKSVNPKENQPRIFTGKPYWSWNSNTLAMWYEELTHWKRLLLGKVEKRRKREQQRMRLLDAITNSMDMSESEQTLGDDDGKGSLAYCIHGGTKSWHDWVTEQQVLLLFWSFSVGKSLPGVLSANNFSSSLTVIQGLPKTHVD